MSMNGNTGKGLSIPTPVAIALIFFATVVVGLVAGLVYTGKDIGQFYPFLIGFVPVALGQILTATKVEKIAQTSETTNQTVAQQSEVLSTVSKAVNGNLDAKFNSLTQHVTDTAQNTAPNPGDAYPVAENSVQAPPVATDNSFPVAG